MNIRPLRTVPLRLGLMIARKRNARSRNRLGSLERRYSIWAKEDTQHHEHHTLTAEIHPYAGLGHQLASWIAGYLWARDLGLNYEGGRTTSNEGGLFTFQPLPPDRGQARGARTIKLAAVADERDPRSLAVLCGQVHQAHERYPGVPIRFQLALDQGRWDQTPAEDVVRNAVLRGAHGETLRRIESDPPYIALHIRRGDVLQGMKGGTTTHSRWVDESWYVDIVRGLRQQPHLAGMEVRAYALGEATDFRALQNENVTIRLNGDRDRDFIELCAARVLVAAPSSFSFTAGLVSRGAVIALFPWWHNIPDSGRWVRTDAQGQVSTVDLQRALNQER